MIDASALTSALQKVVLDFEDDLRARVEGDATLRGRWVIEHQQAITRQRTASAWVAWRDDRVTQAAVAWVLASVFVRFCEDNALVGPVWIAGPEPRRQEALDAQLAYFRAHPLDTDREWLQQAINHLAALPATAELVGGHSALHLVAPSGGAVTKLLAFWRAKTDTGRLMYDFTDSSLDTRFLGDLYQDLSAYAKATFALLQTPVFVEEFILDRTLEPALAERPLEGFRMIDPTCGSGHFLLGAFERLLDRWQKHAPAGETQWLVQQALEAIHGVDLNPFAVAIARFRLTVAALKACGLRSLEQAPAFRYHLAVGDSLLHGPGQQTLHGDADLSGFAYETEDLEVLQTILAGGRYDAVVGNPPYITVKDPVLNQAYRERYTTCSGKYALTAPFMERFIGLAKSGVDGRPSGWTGQITSNSFMKREFGIKLIRDFLPSVDLRLVVDSSGAFIPGHNKEGTPTAIIVAKPGRPNTKTVRVVQGIKGEPSRPAIAADGFVWSSIASNWDNAGYEDIWLSVTDLPRARLAEHPWTLTGGASPAVLASLMSAPEKLQDRVAAIGFVAVTGEDDAFVSPYAVPPRWRSEALPTRSFVEGDTVRDWCIAARATVIYPYDAAGNTVPEVGRSENLWPVRTSLRSGLAFGKTRRESGREWFEYILPQHGRLSAPYLITYARKVSHNHFVLDRGGRVFKESAPVIQLPKGADENDYIRLLAVLNSSAVCFFMRAIAQHQGGGAAAHAWSWTYEFSAANIGSIPLPHSLPLEAGRAIDAMAQRLAVLSPEVLCSLNPPSASMLDDARRDAELTLAAMVAAQEELDWAVYQAYGLVDNDFTYAEGDPPPVARGERAFEIALARKVSEGEEETAWFTRHGVSPTTDIPAHWPVAYQELVQRRLDLIASDPAVRLLERPEYKRRWAGESWEKRQERALRGWLLERLEDRRFWFDGQGRPSPRSVAQLADEVARDADLMSVLVLWEGRRDVPLTESLVRLLEPEAVPFLAAYRYKDSGLRKREAWEQTWALQRREDAGEQVSPIPVPPKYTSADFRKPSYWQARGKLDVPKERFVLYPDAGRAGDPTPLLGWAGWDHAQQSLALSVVIGAREAEGWADERLVPLVAGLCELQPWVEQWHADVDPTYGVSLAAFCREQLNARMTQVGETLEALAAWRPEAPTRGRRPKAT